MSQACYTRYQTQSTPLLGRQSATSKQSLAINCNGSRKTSKPTLSTATLSQDIWRAIQTSSATPKYISAENEYEQPPPPPPSPAGASGWTMSENFEARV